MDEDAGPSLAGEPDSAGSEDREDWPTVERDMFRDAMARLPAAVNIVTTDGPAGRAGFTASAVCSVTDRPPTLLVCLNRAASVHDVFSANEALCVNTLRPDHEALARLFGGKTAMPARFAGGSWTTDVTGAPVLADAAVSFDCRVVRTSVVGTHNVLFCEVVGVRRFGSPEALLYYDRGYRSL